MEDDDRVEDYMLHIVLLRKRGHSATLAVVYLCVARRLDLKCDIIALSGRFLVSIRATKCFVDGSNGGRVLQKRDLGRTSSDLERISRDRGRLFQRNFLTPITPEETLDFLCHGMINEMTSLRLLMVSLIGMMVPEPYESNELLKGCFRALSRRWGLTFKKLFRREESLLT
jgi:hypothetical protein